MDNTRARMQEGSLDEAQALANAWLEREPTNPEAWYEKGRIAWKRGDAGSAIACFNQAVKIKPDFAQACESLGSVLQETRQFALAIKVFEHWLKIEQAVRVNPAPKTGGDALEAKQWFEKGETAQTAGNAEKAEESFRQVLVLQPDMPAALTNLAIALDQQRRHAEAQETLMHCLHVKPGFVDALNILGKSFATTGQPLKAIAAWRQILAAQPTHLPALINTAKALSGLGLLDEAIATYEQVLAVDSACSEILPEFLHILHYLCRWDRAAEIRKKMEAILKGGAGWMEPYAVCVHLPALQLGNAKRYAAKFYPAGAYDPARPLPSTDDKLRIGYLSSDLHDHATARLMCGLFEQHDRAQFDIHVYSHGRDDASPLRQRILAAVQHFHDIRSMNDRQAADLIRRDGIDILVDLKGYTRGQRLSLMALRPAPVQMHYLGFPGTTGAPFIDYFISDTIASPAGSDAEFSEALIRLRGSYQVNDRLRPLPQQARPRTEYGLPEQGFVFCDFNSPYKITREMFAVWMRLLSQVEGSVLWLLENHPEATANLRKEAQGLGVDPARIVVAKNAPLAEHLARYQRADLCIDSFPVCGHTTASDALWCGVPVVTLAGDTFISRVAASLLHAVELPELVTKNLAEYEALALSLARDPARLAKLKKHLESGRMHFPLFDCAATTRALERAYLEAAQKHRDKLAPQAFNV